MERLVLYMIVDVNQGLAGHQILYSIVFDSTDCLGAGCIAPTLHLYNLLGHRITGYMRICMYRVNDVVDVTSFIFHAVLVCEHILELGNQLQDPTVRS